MTLELSPFCPQSPVFLYASLEKCKYVSLTGRIVKFGIYINRLVAGDFHLSAFKSPAKCILDLLFTFVSFLGKEQICYTVDTKYIAVSQKTLRLRDL